MSTSVRRPYHFICDSWEVSRLRFKKDKEYRQGNIVVCLIQKYASMLYYEEDEK